MRKEIKDTPYGTVTYEESFWTGKKAIYIGASRLSKVAKDEFAITDADGKEMIVSVSGNFVKGAEIVIKQKHYSVTPSVKWYEIVLAIIPFVMIMTFGNVPSLFKVLPVVGGAIGGGISGFLGFGGLVFMKKTEKWYFKILIGLLTIGLSILICYLIAAAIIAKNPTY